MRRTVQRRTAIGFIALVALLLPSLPASASPPWDPRSDVIVLDGATSAEGIAAGEGRTFYAGDLALGDIYRGDIRDKKAELFIDVSDFDPKPRMAVGMKADTRNDLLFVAGGDAGTAYVYDTEKGKPAADPITLTTRPNSFINDVTLTRDGAWFTNSKYPELYFVPVSRWGHLGTPETLALTDPALALADPETQFGLNGIADAKGGRVLIVAHSFNQALYAVDPETGESARIKTRPLPNADGILVRGQTAWVVQNQLNRIARIDLSNDFSSGDIEDRIRSRDFNVPTTAALFGNTLAAVNAQFGQTEDKTFEVVLVPAR